MNSYEEIKKKIVENKQVFVLVVCFVLVFLTGYGAGKFQTGSNKPKRVQQSNYTTTPKVPATGEVKGTVVQAALTTSTPPQASGPCIVKGNISSAGKKIYHVKGGAFYDRTNPEQCFNTEQEARAAGFVKSSR